MLEAGGTGTPLSPRACWLLLFVIGACAGPKPTAPAPPEMAATAPAFDAGIDAGIDAAAVASAPDAGPSCGQRREEMFARLAPLAVNGRYLDIVRRDRGVVDEPAPPELCLVSRGNGSSIDIHTPNEGIESSRKRLDDDLDAALAKRALPVAYWPRWASRVGEARRMLRALSARGPAFVLVVNADVPALTSDAKRNAWAELGMSMSRCGAEDRSERHPKSVIRLASRLARCGCDDLDTIERSIRTLATPRGLFALTYDPKRKSLGRFKADDLFEDVLRAAAAVPLDERMRGVRF